jgi:hypothetical protein
MKIRDRNLLLAEVRDCTISGPRNPVVVCFTSPLPYLIAISSPPLTAKRAIPINQPRIKQEFTSRVIYPKS